jgi:hypothetical protein
MVEDETLLWSILDGGNTRQGGKWWLLDVTAAPKLPGAASADLWSDDDDEEWSLREEPEFLYMELDPDANIAHARLVTSMQPPYTEEEAARTREFHERRRRGESDDRTAEIFFYDATTNVAPVVEEARGYWSREPQPWDPGVPAARAAHLLETTRAAGDEILGQSPSSAAIAATAYNTLYKWRQAPFLSGEKRVIPYADRFRDSDEYARLLFEVDEGFYGVQP